MRNGSAIWSWSGAFPVRDEVREQSLLRLFLIEKAAYEVAYEAANRPTWIDVPLHGLAQLIDMAVTP